MWSAIACRIVSIITTRVPSAPQSADGACVVVAALGAAGAAAGAATGLADFVSTYLRRSSFVRRPPCPEPLRESSSAMLTPCFSARLFTRGE